MELSAVSTPTTSYGDMGWLLSFMGFASLILGDLPLSLKHLREALEASIKAKNVMGINFSLVLYALILVERGELNEAVTYYFLAQKYPFIKNSKFFEEVIGVEILSEIEKNLDSNEITDIRSHAQTLDPLTVAQELLLSIHKIAEIT